jgi:hypothetical protein
MVAQKDGSKDASTFESWVQMSVGWLVQLMVELKAHLLVELMVGKTAVSKVAWSAELMVAQKDGSKDASMVESWVQLSVGGLVQLMVELKAHMLVELMVGKTVV